MADDSTLPSPGDVLAGKYQIERLIGRGGMGAVFAAQHMLLNQRVAVKLLLGELASSQEATARFMNEARAAARIQGEHVARVLDIGQLPSGTPYMVLEYLEGSDLADLLKRRGVLSVPEVADYALQALDALGQAHAAGIVHRDLKPANLFLAKRHDGTSVVKVLDFGISKNLSPLAGTPQGMTQTRALLGSPEYMSPEQLRTPRGVDARTDIWSLGVILYELLSGSMPFTGESLGELFMQIMEATPPPLRSRRGDVPAALEGVVARCLNRDPNARFANVRELAEVLRVFASDQMRALLAVQASAPGLSSGHILAPTQPMGVPAVTANRGPITAAPWAHTGGSANEPTGLPDPKRAKRVAIAAGSILAIVGVLGVVALVSRKADPAPAALQGLTMDSTAAPVNGSAASPTPSASATAGAVAPPDGAVVAPSKLPAALPAPKAAAVSPPKSQAGQAAPTSQPPPGTPAAASPAPAAPGSKNCSPNYYFDKDGRKHFKPECF
jgi:tRNA A-37 threonylcarbamoyl transferase component Bud32